MFECFPDVAFTVEDVAVSGWPWRTNVAVRVTIRAQLPDGTADVNQATQWVRRRWAG